MADQVLLLLQRGDLHRAAICLNPASSFATARIDHPSTDLSPVAGCFSKSSEPPRKIRGGLLLVSVKLLGEFQMKELAREYANIAHSHLFQHKFGVTAVEELNPPALCFFNNNPYKQNLIVADVQRAAFLQRLSDIGIDQLGHAEYPESGPDEGYSYAIILDVAATEENAARVKDIWTDVFMHVGWENQAP